jgi:protease-4
MSSKRRLALSFGVVAVMVAAFAVAVYLIGENKSTALFGDKIGLVVVRGVIADPAPTLKALHEFRKNKDIRAILLRVDSPGGGVGASQEIFREVQRVKRVKPVVCSMGAVAASGGLYISAPCTKIVANPGTITGSIGVILTIPEMQKLFDKIGIRMQVVKSGDVKAAGQIDRPLSEAERTMLEKLSKDIYEQFVQDVSKSRRIPLANVRSIADGGVFSGQKAKELGLVDELGNFMDAVSLAAKLAGIKGDPQLVYPKDDFQGLLERMFRDESRALVQGLLEGLQSTGSLQYLYRPNLPAN